MSEIPYGTLGTWPIQSASAILNEFEENGLDCSNWIRKANSYRCAVGPEPGVAWVLMKQSDIASMNSASPQTLVLGLGSNSITVPRLAVIQAQRLIPGISLDPDALYIVQLADARWFLKRTYIEKRYNLRKTCSDSEWCDGTTNDVTGEPWTFLEILEDIFTKFNSFGGFLINSTWNEAKVHSANSGEFDPPETPENLRFEGISAWDALDQTCQQCGYFLRYNPFVGDIRIMQVGLAADPEPGEDGDLKAGYGGVRSVLGLATNYPLAPDSTVRSAGDDLLEDSEMILGSAMIPASVSVVFPTNDTDCGDGCEIDANHGWFKRIEVTAASVREDNPAEEYKFLESAIVGTTVVLNSTKYAQFDSSDLEDPTNIDELTTAAKEIAADYYRAIAFQASGRVVYAGIKRVVPGPHISEVIWRDWGDGLQTEVARWPVPVGLPKIPKRFTGGSGGGTIIVRFRLEEPVFCEACTASALVISRPSGMSSVPGEDPYENLIVVTDMTGCFLNEPRDDLVGRYGYAAYMDFTEGTNQPGCPGLENPGWEIISMCCFEDRC